MKVPGNYSKPKVDESLLSSARPYSGKFQEELAEEKLQLDEAMLLLFRPNWAVLNALPTGTIENLVAQSVGICFLDNDLTRSSTGLEILSQELNFVDFVRLYARPYFELREKITQVQRIDTFLVRLRQAKENIAPLGQLTPISGTDLIDRRFSKAEFVAWAVQSGWDMPEEFKRFHTLTDEEDLGEAEEDNDQNNKVVREQPIQAIIAKAKEFEYDLLSIPLGGKAEIKKACYPAITESAFNRAWIAAGKRGLISIKDKHKYCSKQ